MEKSRKLRRYTRKDYTQLVDFPVEIVGRDGVVRRYSFEESVRLYQRRIASANVRYDDQDVVSAEVRHCRRRIEQLRRSYFARYGWASIRIMDRPGVFAGEYAGEVAAFLRRCLEDADFDPESLEISLLEESPTCQTYYVRPFREEADPPPGDDSGSGDENLLYLYLFDNPGACPARDSFFDFIKVLQGVDRQGDQIEALVAFHHTADCGLILTGRSGAAVLLVDPSDGELPPVDMLMLDPDADRRDLVREAMALLRQGDREGALRKFVAAYEENHYRRTAYLGAAVVADQLGEHREAETAALMGSRYFPSDGSLLYHLAVARLRRGDAAGAGEALDRAEAAEGPTFATRLVRAMVLLRSGHMVRGWRALERSRSHADPTDYDLIRSHSWVRAQVLARFLLRGTGWLLTVAGLAIASLGWAWALGLSLAGLLLIPASHRAWSRQFVRLLDAPGDRGLRLANPSSLRAEAASSPQ